MEALLRALTEILVGTRFAKGPPAPRELRVDLGAAPDAVKALAEALAANYYNVDLGEFSMFHNGAGDVVFSLSETIATSSQNAGLEPDWVAAHAGAGGAPFDPEQTLELGADAGGMSALGVSWSGSQLTLIVVEIDDPVEENLVRHFTTPAAFFAFLDDKNDGEEESAHVTALKGAVG